MSSLSSKTEHRSRGDNREQKVQGPIAVVAPPFPPFPAICSQKRHAIKDRHLLPVSLALRLPHTNTLLAWWDPSETALHKCSLPRPVQVRWADLKDCQQRITGHSFQQPAPGGLLSIRNLLFFTRGQHTCALSHTLLRSPSHSPLRL